MLPGKQPGKRVVLIDDLYNPLEDGPHMEFRLTYNGPLYSTQGDPPPNQQDKRAGHKHVLRKTFHKQLRRLWEITPYLKNEGGIPHLRAKWNAFGGPGGEPHDIRRLSEKHAHFGFKFVPLITYDMDLLCGLDVLFLRPDKPGHVMWAGDLDNRIKTLIDALRIPKANERYDQMTQEADETPFFCLLEEDELVTKLSIESDQLLEFESPSNMDEVRLVITVRVRPFQMHMGNLEFGG
jgi:hypothetical protein